MRAPAAADYLLHMDQRSYLHGAERAHPTGNDREPAAVAAPAISTAVLLGEGLVLGWLVLMTSAMCGNACHDDRNEPGFSLILNVCTYALVIPVASLLISWLLPYRRRYRKARLATAVLAPMSLAGIYVLFNVWLALG
ncbi:hypothetical protein [Streptomyces sp. NPDC059649]|uniref:hypothetical protein n=1 Tax=Streptomyces sp. NPDC059649 TaxID=3346895 RepID=UPI00367B6CBE